MTGKKNDHVSVFHEDWRRSVTDNRKGESVRLLYVNPIATGVWDDDILQILKGYKEPGTHVDVTHLEQSTGDCSGPFLPSTPDLYDDLFTIMKYGEKYSYNGIMIGCAADPGLREATYMRQVPIFGPLQAGLYLAALLGHRISPLVPSHDVEEKGALNWHENSIRRYGIERDRITDRPVKVGQPPDAVMERLLREKRWDEVKEAVMSRFRDSATQDGVTQAKAAVEEDEAEVLLFGCNFWGRLLAPVAEAVGALVLDPVAAMLKTAGIVITSCVF